MKDFGKTGIFLVAVLTAVFFAGCEKNEDDLSVTIDFESVSLPEKGFLDAEEANGAHNIEGVSFLAQYNEEYMTSSGVIISSLTDTETPGFINSYSVYTGEGAGGSTQFAVVNPPFGYTDAIITFEEAVTLESVAVSNTTYAALSMKDGDAFAKAFSAEDEDFFKVIFTGFDSEGNTTGEVSFYLADFQNGSTTGIVSSWQNVELGSLGSVNGVGVTFESSDVGTYGINTPMYVAIDNLSFKD